MEQCNIQFMEYHTILNDNIFRNVKKKNFGRKKDISKKLYKIITQMRIMTSKTTIRVLTSQFRLDIV